MTTGAERARALARTHPAGAELLTFYAELATLQDSLLEAAPATWRVRPAPPTFAARLEPAVVAACLPALLAWIAQRAPLPLAQHAAALQQGPASDREALVGAYWAAPRNATIDLPGPTAFVVEALLQPFAAALAHDEMPSAPQPVSEASPREAACGVCGSRPTVATLREQGHGARRGLVCGLCLAETPWPRVTCPTCGEGAFDRLGIYKSAIFPAVQIDACDACRTYLKTLDLTSAGAMDPIADDLASVALDLWAAEQGYRKLRPNLLRI